MKATPNAPKLTTFKDLGLTYEVALHGVQTAIMHEIERERPNKLMHLRVRKHLRVGIDSAHVSQAALAEVLIRKGIMTRKEYEEALRLVMNNELAMYEERINKSNNPPTKLIFR
jgi:hypothetical protein